VPAIPELVQENGSRPQAANRVKARADYIPVVCSQTSSMDANLLVAYSQGLATPEDPLAHQSQVARSQFSPQSRQTRPQALLWAAEVGSPAGHYASWDGNEKIRTCSSTVWPTVPIAAGKWGPLTVTLPYFALGIGAK